MARSGLDEEFRHNVDRAVLVLYGSVIEGLGWATAALLDQDLELAERLIAEDRLVDERCRELTALIKDRLAKSSLRPADLEDMVTIVQMVPELERSADLAEHIARRARMDLGGRMTPRCRGLVQSLCDAGIRLWQLSSRAYAERSRDLPFDIDEADDELDYLSAALVEEGVGGAVEPATAAQVALIARFYERLGDHAVNLARRSATISMPSRPQPARLRGPPSP